MNVIGKTLTVLTSPDPSMVGRTGVALLETANMLLIDSGGKSFRLPKSGASFMLIDSGTVVTGSDIAGRLQDRLGRQSP
jgi:RNase P/RNase MRP subunit p29